MIRSFIVAVWTLLLLIGGLQPAIAKMAAAQGRYFGQSGHALIEAEVSGDVLLVSRFQFMNADIRLELTCENGTTYQSQLGIDPDGSLRGSCSTVAGTVGGAVRGTFPRIALDHARSTEIVLIREDELGGYRAAVAAGTVQTTAEWIADRQAQHRPSQPQVQSAATGSTVTEGRYFGRTPTAMIEAEIRGGMILFQQFQWVQGDTRLQLTCEYERSTRSELKLEVDGSIRGQCSTVGGTVGGTVFGTFPRLLIGDSGKLAIVLVAEQQRAGFEAAVRTGSVQTTAEWQSQQTAVALQQEAERQRQVAQEKSRELDNEREKRQALEAQLGSQAQAQPIPSSQPLASIAQKTASREQVSTTEMANRKALVIGNDLYKHVGRLANAVADAEAMAIALRSTGFMVFKHTNLDERAFKAALRDFRLRVEPGDEVVVFYAGHGVQLKSTNFLLPIDLKGDDEEQVRDEAIQLQRILEDLQERRAKFALAVIDACRDNPFKSQGRSIGTGRGLAPTTAATGQMIIYSAGSGQQALDKLNDRDPSRNGLFTRVFLKEMMQPGVSVDRVLRNVRTEVVRLATSVGHDQTPALYDQVVGDFFFRR